MLTVPRDVPDSRGNSDRDYFQIAPEKISEGLQSKIVLGEHAPDPPSWHTSLGAASFLHPCS